MIRTSSGAWRHAARAAAASLACAFLAACGSGGVTDNTVTSGGPITITPSTATLYSNLPTTFLITGGTGTYTILSSDQAVVPVAETIKGNSLTIVPNDVSADTTITLTVTDASSAAVAPVTATLTVKPRTISNTVTVTPSSSECGTAVCAGGDAEVKVTLTQAGVPLAGRQVRFGVVSGDAAVITSGSSGSETLAPSGTSTTDGSGTARARIRVSTNAPSQTAILEITDVSSGFTQTTSVTIAAPVLGELGAQPTTVAFIGPTDTTCANGSPVADVIVFGGHPPYQISQPTPFLVSPTVVGGSGGHFTITPEGQCVATPTAIAVVDANGASTTVNVTSSVGASAPVGSAFGMSPSSVTLDACTAVATVAGVGGTGTYFFADGPLGLTVKSAGANAFTIQRTPATPPMGTPAILHFTDGRTTVPVNVNLVNGGAGTC